MADGSLSLAGFTTKRQRHQRRLAALKEERNLWESHWREIADQMCPERMRLNSQDRAKKGQELRGKIINPHACWALRTLKSGMHSGITSPSRPWYRIGTFDEDLREYGPVKNYLGIVERRMREVYATSNFYNVTHEMYGDLGAFAQGCYLLLVDDWDYIRLQMLITGQYWLGNDYNGRVNICYRQCDMTTEQLVNRFAPINGMGHLPRPVRDAFDRGNYDIWWTVFNAIEPREQRDRTKANRQNMPYLSNYWMDESAGEHDLLEESGFNHNPIIAPRWDVIGSDSYGTASPGHESLPDIKQLQRQERRMAEAIDKVVRPPMKGPTSLMNNPKSLLPGGITYVDDPSGSGFTPAMTVAIRLTELEAKIEQTERRVDRTFYADLFTMLQNMDGVQPRNVLELTQRKEEQLLQLGPVLERLYNEALNRVISITYNIMQSAHILPEPPEELHGKPLKTEYISTLAQAQKAVSTGAIERLFGFAGNLAAAKPEVLDKLDFDQTIDEYADMVGSPPNLVRSDEDAAKDRAARQQQQQAAANAEMMNKAAPMVSAGAQAATALTQTDASGTGGGAPVQQLLSSLGLG
jgi:hypothetical protein